MAIGNPAEEASGVDFTSGLVGRVGEALERMKYRDCQILMLRYGLNGEEPQELEQVGRIFNLGKERIRQIQNIALGHLAEALSE